MKNLYQYLRFKTIGIDYNLFKIPRFFITEVVTLATICTKNLVEQSGIVLLMTSCIQCMCGDINIMF